MRSNSLRKSGAIHALLSVAVIALAAAGAQPRAWAQQDWEFEVVDVGVTEWIGQDVSIAFAAGGSPGIAYLKPIPGNLYKNMHFTRPEGDSWVSELVAERMGYRVNLAYDPVTDRPTIAFPSYYEGFLRFARRDATGPWAIRNVDAEADLIDEIGLAYGPEGPCIAYWANLYIGGRGIWDINVGRVAVRVYRHKSTDRML